MKEVWKQMTGYEGIYEISNMGNIVTLIEMPKKFLSGITIAQIGRDVGMDKANTQRILSGELYRDVPRQLIDFSKVEANNKTKKSIIAEILSMRASGSNVKEIIKKFNLGSTTVYRILKTKEI